MNRRSLGCECIQSIIYPFIVITDNQHSDGENGLLLFRGHSFEQLWDNDFEDMIHLMVWETLPSQEEKEELRKDIADVACSIPDSVAQAVRNFPYV